MVFERTEARLTSRAVSEGNCYLNPEGTFFNPKFFTLIWALGLIGTTVAYIVLLITAWRLMRAHEKIADKLNDILNRFPQK